MLLHALCYKPTSSPLPPWKTCCKNSRHCHRQSRRGRTLFEAKGLPQRIQELTLETGAADIWNDQKRAQAMFTELKALKKQWEPVQHIADEAQALLEMVEAASEEEQIALAADAGQLEKEWLSLETQLYLSGEFDAQNCYLTVSGGAGGTEAQDWAAMLMRMYLRYCERQQWKTTIVEKTDGQEAGIKTATIHVEGTFAYGNLKCEKGTHRLVRLSPFNAKSLRQTSFALVEVLPELPESTGIEINPSDLRIDTYRSGGAGGQNVNKVESAIRITHLPSGIVVACQNERSQLQNRQQAMNMLRAKLLEKERREQLETKAELKGAKQSADFGQQIRSYVLHPYQMVKDLRTDVETSNTTGVLDGDIQQFIDAELKREERS
ncbi:MAG: peptide chain release factor 2 [Candidatus Peribacteraceae bacterium]|nr:peptide chain release factor 2 [Candidatus Peribacteraceae bacterium]